MIENDLTVIHIAPGNPFGGLQRLAINLAATQRSRGINASLVWTRRVHPTLAACERADVACISLDGSIGARATQLALHLRRKRPDIIHLHMAPPWIGPLLPDRSNVVVHLHHMPGAPATLRARIGAMLEPMVLAKADSFIAVSDWIKAAWREVHPCGSFTIVYNGIRMPPALTELRERPASAPTLGMGSRLASDKGVHEFVDFALELHRRLPQARFVVAGQGPERAALEQRAAPLVRAGLFTFLGFVDDMAKFWSSLDLAVFTSANEPFGLRLIEPLAHGVPVVAYRTGAGSDEIVDLCRGIEAVANGDAAALAALTVDLLNDKARRVQMAEAGFDDLCARFTLESMADRVEDVYAQARARRQEASGDNTGYFPRR